MFQSESEAIDLRALNDSVHSHKAPVGLAEDVLLWVNSGGPTHWISPFPMNGFVVRFELHEGTRATHVPEHQCEKQESLRMVQLGFGRNVTKVH